MCYNYYIVHVRLGKIEMPTSFHDHYCIKVSKFQCYCKDVQNIISYSITKLCYRSGDTYNIPNVSNIIYFSAIIKPYS